MLLTLQEMWSSQLPEVQVVRHTSPLTPSQLPDTTASLLAPTVTSSTQLPVRAARSGKFSSDFVQFGALSSLREEDRGGEGGIVGERRGEEGGREEEEEGERRTEDTSSSQHPMLPDTSSQCMCCIYSGGEHVVLNVVFISQHQLNLYLEPQSQQLQITGDLCNSTRHPKILKGSSCDWLPWVHFPLKAPAVLANFPSSHPMVF